MAPGPHGGPGGPRGPRGGGPHGGFGGPHGGFGGPRGGGWGYGPHHGRPIRVVPPKYTGGRPASSNNDEPQYVDENGNPITEGAYRRKKYGNIKGTILGLRLNTTGAMKEEMFKAKCATADDLLKGKRITLAEANKRKMDAATAYYGYLKKIGSITGEEYDVEMTEFARLIGANYIPQNNNVNRRTR